MASTYKINNIPSNVTIANGGYATTGSTITLNSGAGTNSWLTSTGTSSAWVSPNTTFTSTNGKAVMTMPYGEDKVVLEEKAALEVKGKVIMNGIDLEERLKTIEKVLMIPERDATMEAKYPSLKKKYDEYIAALGKYRTFEAIKGKDE